MLPFNGQSPLIERPATTKPAPSPAREALKGNLEAAGESTLSLRKKNSWIGSLRDAVHKGALHAKAAVDMFRSDQHNNDKPTEPPEAICVDSGPEANQEHGSPPRESLDSMTKSLISSTTPLRSDGERRHWLGPKAATISLRQHLSSHPSRMKRSSVYSVTGRPSSEVAGLAGPEEFKSLATEDGNVASHTRQSSVANSIVGSIRGIGRRAGKAKPTRACTKDVSPKVSAEIMTSSSSPINIPAAAPSLDLDLGPGGFMTPMFGRSPERDLKERAVDAEKLMNPANITTGVPPPIPILASDHLPMRVAQHWPFRPATPRDFLKIQIDDVEPMPAAGPGPATPMPGTSFALELDGANSEKSDKLHVFERSVTPSLERESKELRKMRSLDAMAEACTIAHAHDELSGLTELPSPFDAVAIGISPGQGVRHQTPRRDNLSSETTRTLHTCPPNMQELARQRTPEAVRQVAIAVAKVSSDHSGNSVYEDPFDDSNAVKSGPLSPDRTIELPFRPKIDPETKIGHATSGHEEEQPKAKVEIVGQKTAGLRSSSFKLQSQTSSRHPSPFPKENFNPSQTAISDEDTRMQAEHLATSNIALPIYDNISSPVSEGASPHAEILMPWTYNPTNTSQNTSPRSVRSRTTYTAGLRDTEYKFSFDDWLQEASGAAPPESEPATPHRRRMDMSLDSVSTSEDWKTLEGSRSTTASKRTPSMGTRLDFDLKRSERNTRYNALHQASVPLLREAMQSSLKGPPRFILVDSDETDATGIHLANFESAYVTSSEATPQKDGDALPARVGSDDSVADSLKNAALDYSQLEERLADDPRSEDVFADPTSDTEFGDLPSEGFEVIDISHAGPSTLQGTPMKASIVGNAHDNASEQDPGDHFEFRPVFGSDRTAAPQSSPLPTIPQSLTEIGIRTSPATQFPMTVTGIPSKDRVASSDTLDRSLKFVMSSESGYQVDESSICEPNASAAKARPARYSSKGNRGRMPLGEISDNIG